MVAGVGLLGLVGLGAVGGIVANIALTPLTAGASLLQSYWYGAGLILGERMMYTVHWEKIKGRLDKGESFMNVLDAEMNKDITAIANLSFKAMEDTGALFISQGGKTLAALIEELAAAALNPFFSGDRDPTEEEPPPPGEETPEGVVLSIEQIQAMTREQLLFALQQTSIIYSDGTIQHMKTVLAQKQLDFDKEKEEEEAAKLTFSGSLEEQKQFSLLLNVTTLQNVWQFLLTLPSTLQTKISGTFTPIGLFFSTQIRTQSTGSDEVLAFYFKHLKTVTDKWRNAINQGGNFDLRLFQENVLHIMFVIHTHQLIYSR